ncbi:hypothetical protein CCAX7_17380 [Capsulimonas corticalis]|uniref:Uncharacterized protein n=1 Tax=Capsulimonas corticalis TaxID=2219043 RepID=A0A402D3T2_9BACT|nr:hypothetical protein [Capsulimonas corticalis]BDI29687.1 hypothetical protein CCAX7_17380 [Capsulimonas corticalis]
MSLYVHQTLYENLCAALRKPLSQGGHLALTATLCNQSAQSIADAAQELTDDEMLALFNWLDDTRAEAILPLLGEERAAYVLLHAPPGRLASRLTHLSHNGDTD